MQQRPRDHTSHLIRTRRTQPSLPVNTLPTAPTVVPAQQVRAIQQVSIKKRTNLVRRAAWKLSGLGALLAILYFALYPLLAGAIIQRDTAKQALYAVFPWLPRLYWTAWAPLLVQGLSRVSMFNLSRGAASSYANLLGALLALAFIVLLFCVLTGNRVSKEKLSRRDVRLIFLVLFAFTALFSVIFLLAPAVQTQDVFLYAAYGRIAAVDRLNPYVLQGSIARATGGNAPYGPLWIDLTLPVALLTHGNVASSVAGFRLLALVAHLTNTILIWAILSRLKPQMRISGTLLYAWNPVVLLLGISEMHNGIVVVLLILLSIYCFQRKFFMLNWIFLLLAALINALCLLLLPLALRQLWRESRPMGQGRRFLWWLAMLCLSAAIVVLVYFPYRLGWGITGMLASIERTFLQDNAINSLNAALLHLPAASSPILAWITAPHHWIILAAAIVGVLLLLGLWLADTLELVLFFDSWIFLVLFVLAPMNWPWYILLPLALAIASASRPTILLAILLALGAALEYYFWLWPQVWPGMALVTAGLPALAWGWTLFFTSTWHMAHAKGAEQPVKEPARGFSFSRPSWSSWPSRPSWPRRK